MGSLLFPGVWQAYPATLKLACLEQVSANRYVTMVIYQKLLPRTKKRGVFYLSLKISLLNRLASYDEYPPWWFYSAVYVLVIVVYLLVTVAVSYVVYLFACLFVVNLLLCLVCFRPLKPIYYTHRLHTPTFISAA